MRVEDYYTVAERKLRWIDDNVRCVRQQLVLLIEQCPHIAQHVGPLRVRVGRIKRPWVRYDSPTDPYAARRSHHAYTLFVCANRCRPDCKWWIPETCVWTEVDEHDESGALVATHPGELWPRLRPELHETVIEAELISTP
jgi:hypothetical protein